MVLQEFTAGSTVPLDYRSMPIRTGDYVLILNAPGYPGVEPGHLGRVVGRRWFDSDGTLNVDVVGSAWQEVHRVSDSESVGKPYVHCVNLNFEPVNLRRVSEAVITAGRVPRTICVEVDKAAYDIELDPELLQSQYERLKSFRILEESVCG